MSDLTTRSVEIERIRTIATYIEEIIGFVRTIDLEEKTCLSLITLIKRDLHLVDKVAEVSVLGDTWLQKSLVRFTHMIRAIRKCATSTGNCSVDGISLVPSGRSATICEAIIQHRRLPCGLC